MKELMTLISRITPVGMKFGVNEIKFCVKLGCFFVLRQTQKNS